MANLNRPARLNRALLAVLGLVLLAAGAFALVTHFGALRVLDPAAPVVPSLSAPPTWVYYAVIAVAVVLGLLCLRLLAAQAFRRPRPGTWRFETEPERGGTKLSGSVATEPLAEEVTAYQGVRSVNATLAGRREDPTLYLTVGTEQGADLGELRERIDEHAVPRLRRALDLDALPVVLEFRLTSKTGARAL